MRTGLIGLMLAMLLMSCGDQGPTAPVTSGSDPAEIAGGAALRVGLGDEQALDTTDALESGAMKTRRYLNVLRHVDFGRTRASARLVAKSAQAFDSDNDGWYPRHVADRNLRGKTLIDYLPAGKMLKNAYTQIADQPHDQVAGYIGGVAYAPIYVNGYAAGYTVSAMGNSPDQTFVIVHEP
jgi:hypothetical protein